MDSVELPAGERDLTTLAVAAGLIQTGATLTEEQLNWAYAIVYACSRIGDGYWHEESSAGAHIRAIYFP